MRALWSALLFLGCALLAGCASDSRVPPAPPGFPADATGDARWEPAQQLLKNRGLYLDNLGQVRLLDDSHCGIRLEAHRGHPRLAENSLLAVYGALQSGLPSVEVDIMRLRDGNWVLHHDKRTGRVAGRRDGATQFVELLNSSEFAALRLREVKTGRLTDTPPTFLSEVVELMKRVAKPGQRLNLELKSDATRAQLAGLHAYLSQHLGSSQFYYSSMSTVNDPELLGRVRAVAPDAPLAIVLRPHTRSLTEAAKEKGPEAQRWSEWLAGKTKRALTSSTDQATLARWARELGPNLGLHVDIRTLVSDPELAARARKAGFGWISTYTVNSQAYHEEQLLALKKRGRLPDQVIVDASQYRVCQRLFPLAWEVGELQNVPQDPLAQLFARLPADADLEEVGQQREYAKSDQYLTLDGRVRPLRTTAVRRNSAPIRAGVMAVPSVAEDEALELDAVAPVKIRLPSR